MLQFITDSPDPTSTAHQAILAMRGGCKWIQVRMKEATDADVIKAMALIRPHADSYKATVILDDRVHLVNQTKADGVHIGKNDTPPAEARTCLGKKAIIGSTVNSIDDIIALDHTLINYMGMGPYRFTTTKKRLAPTLGLDGYRTIMSQIRIAGITTPVVAIGGINLSDIRSLIATGIHGIAVSGAIAHSDDIVGTTRQFLETIEKQQ